MSVAAPERSGLEVLLDHVKQARGFDFTGYKHATLERRVAKRLEAVGAQDYDAYLDYLEVHPDEFAALFDTVLINVTSFFRDADAWDYLATEILPRVLESAGDRPLRVWCAGCSSGEETLTMVMVLVQALGEAQYLERVKIYATDVDDDALDSARHAIYDEKQVQAVPEPLRERFFERVDERYVFRRDLRRTVIFGRNDLIQDAPISRIDLLSCRNTLMYFNAETQAQILSRLHFALNEDGYLFLGRSEMLITHAELFKPASPGRRVFTKVPRATPRARPMFAALAPEEQSPSGPRQISDTAFETTSVAQVVVDVDGILIQANRSARGLFRLAPADIGRPLKDLELGYRPVELRAHVERANSERRTIGLAGISMPGADGAARLLDVEITPLFAGTAALGTSVTFVDVTEQRRLHEELERAQRALEHAYDELQSTVEELETTNEELQSTNEELETTNEELQSSNEELETMNEELQSTNEELETINEELRQRTLELDDVNVFLETILTSMGVGVAVVDGSMNVRIWNHHAVELWGVRSDEVVGRPLLGLDIGLPVEQLKPALRGVLDGQVRAEQELTATNRRGRTIACRVTLLSLSTRDGNAPSGAILLMEQGPPRDGS